MASNDKIVDSIVESVIDKIRTRSEIGIAKYGITLDRTDYSTVDWIDAAIEEQMDNILYLTRLKKDILLLEEELRAFKNQKMFEDKMREDALKKASASTLTSTSNGTEVVYTITPKPNEVYTDEEPIVRKKYNWHR